MSNNRIMYRTLSLKKKYEIAQLLLSKYKIVQLAYYFNHHLINLHSFALKVPRLRIASLEKRVPAFTIEVFTTSPNSTLCSSPLGEELRQILLYFTFSQCIYVIRQA